MKVKISKSEAEKKINEFFKDIKGKTPKEIKKIKRLAMAKKIPLKEKRKMFCKKCLSPYTGKEKIKIKNSRKIIICRACKNTSKWKLS